MQSQFGILGMIQQGYYATYPLLFISVVCLAIIFERVWALWGVGPKTAKLADSLIPQLRQGKFNEALQATQTRATASERIFHTLISGAQTMGRDHLLELDDERRYQEGLEFKRYIWLLATAGASAPVIGVFGTVVRVLAALQSMAIMGTGGFSVVAAGISEALISTALGLAVAIIAVIFYNYFSQRIERINATIHIRAARLIDAAVAGKQANGN